MMLAEIRSYKVSLFSIFFLNLQHYRGMVYNGDTDMACNFLGDQEFVESLGLKVNYIDIINMLYPNIPYHIKPKYTIPYQTIP